MGALTPWQVIKRALYCLCYDGQDAQAYSSVGHIDEENVCGWHGRAHLHQRTWTCQRRWFSSHGHKEQMQFPTMSVWCQEKLGAGESAVQHQCVWLCIVVVLYCMTAACIGKWTEQHPRFECAESLECRLDSWDHLSKRREAMDLRLCLFAGGVLRSVCMDV